MGVEVVQMLRDEALAPLELQREDAVEGDAVVAFGAPLGQFRLGEPAEVPATLLVGEVKLPGERPVTVLGCVWRLPSILSLSSLDSSKYRSDRYSIAGSPRIPLYSKQLSLKLCIRLAVSLFRFPEGQDLRKMSTAMERGFSVEMASKNHVRTLVVSDESQGKVLFEGNLGELKALEMVEEIVLQVTGANGTLRIDIEEDEFRRMLKKKGGAALE